MKKFFTILLIVLFALAVAALIVYGIWWKHWHWWVGVVIGFGALALVFGVWYLKKLLFRKREREFVKRVIEQDEAAIKGAPLHERQQLRELQAKWKEAVEALRESDLRRHGNPLYALPWYLIIGESGSGKTTALKNVDIAAPLTELGHLSGLSGTRNCDWWFFEEAIVLDTAGRYTVHVDDTRDKEEWESFLVLLAKYRKKEPINGVVVTVAVDKLTSGDEKAIRNEALAARKRIEQVMRVLGNRFPVYLLVTKMDKVLGMTEFSAALPQDKLAQAMGYIHEHTDDDWANVFTAATDTIGRELRNLRLTIAHKQEDVLPEVHTFPNRVRDLHPGLKIFMKAAFEDNLYQEAPMLRGLFLSYGRQSGDPIPQYEETFGKPQTPGRGSEDGSFLGDLFRSVLPADRYLFTPIREFVAWKRITRNLKLLSWVLLWLFLSGVLTFSFLMNIRIHQFSSTYFDPTEISEDISANLLMFDKFKDEIQRMHEANTGWLLPRFGLRQSVDLENRLKARYTDLFRDKFMTPLDRKFDATLSEEIGDGVTSEFEGNYAAFTIVRLLLLRDRLHHQQPEIKDKFVKIAAKLLIQETNVSPETAYLFGGAYVAYIQWQSDTPMLENRYAKLQYELNMILNDESETLTWLTDNWVHNVPSVSLTTFWGDEAVQDNTVSGSGLPVVPGAFTAKGHDNIRDFITLIDKAIDDTAAFGHKRDLFWTWYNRRVFESWEQFAVRFDAGSPSHASMTEHQHLASLMTTKDNPYTDLIERMHDEFTAFPKSIQRPPWADLVIELKRIDDQWKTQQDIQAGKLQGKLEEKSQTTQLQALGKTDKTAYERLEDRIEAAKALGAYYDALSKLAPLVTSTESAFKMVSKAYPSYSGNGGDSGGQQDQGGGQSQAYESAYSAFFTFKSVARNFGDQQFVWELTEGPFRYLVGYGFNVTTTILQQQWTSQVVSATQGVDPDKLPTILFDPQTGVVWDYVNNTAGPFIGRNQSGYYAAEAFNRKIPFKDNLFTFLNNGRIGTINYKDEYQVTLETSPLEVNKDATAQPISNSIVLSCRDGDLRLDNYNYPQQKTFGWQPDKCGTVTLTIELPGLTFTKKYTGKWAFAHFLDDFKTGSKTFTVDDFPPGQRQALSDMQIDWIKVTYRITDSDNALSVLKMAPSGVPVTIVKPLDGNE